MNHQENNVHYLGWKIVFLTCVSILILEVQSHAQLSIAPTSVFIDPSSRSGMFMVRNITKEPREITVDFFFGYPASDENGKLFMQKDDSAAMRYSLVPFVKVFPKKIVLPAGEEQMIRLLVLQSPKIENGTYWARMAVKSKPAVAPIETQIKSDSVLAQIQIVVEQVTAAIYQVGKVSAQLQVSEMKLVQDSATISILSSLKREGNSPYWGLAKMHIYDAKGMPVDTLIESFAVYFNLTKKFSFQKSKFSPGTYTAKLLVDSERSDIPKERRVDSKPVSTSYTFSIQ